MRTATTVELSGGKDGKDTVDFVVEAEKLGLHTCWVAEAWGSDAPSALGYIAARTERMQLGSGCCRLVPDPRCWSRKRRSPVQSVVRPFSTRVGGIRPTSD